MFSASLSLPSPSSRLILLLQRGSRVRFSPIPRPCSRPSCHPGFLLLLRQLNLTLALSADLFPENNPEVDGDAAVEDPEVEDEGDGNKISTVSFKELTSVFPDTTLGSQAAIVAEIVSIIFPLFSRRRARREGEGRVEQGKTTRLGANLFIFSFASAAFVFRRPNSRTNSTQSRRKSG